MADRTVSAELRADVSRYIARMRAAAKATRGLADDAEDAGRRADAALEQMHAGAGRLETQLRGLTETERRQAQETRRSSDEVDRHRDSTDRNTRSQERAHRQQQQTTKGLTANRGTLVSLISAAGLAGAGVTAAGVAFSAFGVIAAGSIVKVVAAQKDMATSWDTLTGRQKTSALSVRGLTEDYKALAKSYEPEALAVFNNVIGTTRVLLPQVGGLFNATSDDVQRLVSRLGEFTTGRVGGEFLTWVGQQAPRALDVFGTTATVAGDTALDLVQDIAPLGLEVLELTNGLLAGVNALADFNPLLAQFAVSAFALRAPVAGVVGGVTNMTRRVGAAGTAAEGAAKSGRLLNLVTRAGPNLYVAAGVALGFLALKTLTAKDNTDRYIASLRVANQATGNNLAGYQALSAELNRQVQVQKAVTRAAVDAQTAGSEGAGLTGRSVEALEKYNRALEENNAKIRAINTATGQLSARYGITAEEARRLADAAGVDLSASMDKSGNLTAAARAKIDQYAESAAMAANPTRAVSFALADASNHALSMNDRVKALTNALNLYFNPALAAFQATTNLRQGFRDLGEAAGKSKATFDGHNAASVRLQQVFAQNLGTVRDLHGAVFQKTRSMDAANAAVNRYLPALYAMAGRNREARAAVDGLAQVTGFQIDRTNVSRESFIRQATAMLGSKRQAEALWAAYRNLQNQTGGVSSSTGQAISRVKQMAESMANNQRHTGNATGAMRSHNTVIRQALPVLYALAGNNKTARGQVDALARSIGVATGKTNTSKQAFTEMASRMGIARDRAERLWKELNKIKSRDVHVDVNAQGHWRMPGMLSGPGPFGRRATGGPIPAQWAMAGGGPTEDDVPIMASVGEHMWTAREVQQVGGHGAMYRMRAAAARGELKGYASGGVIGLGRAGSTPATVARVTRPVFEGHDQMIAGMAKAFAAEWKRYANSGGAALSWARTQAGKPYIWGGVGPAGYDCCIIGGVRIYGPDGAKPIQDVRAGNRVFTHVEGRLEVHTVTAAWQSKRQPVFAVRTRNRTVTASANHPFLRVVAVNDRTRHWEDADWPGAVKMPYGSRKGAICNLSTCERPVHSAGMCSMHHSRWERQGDPRVRYTTGHRYETQWARLDELKRGDLLVQPRVMETDAKPTPELPDSTPVDADVAWLLGAVVGDGTVTDKSLRLCLFGEMRERATQIIKARWGGNPGHGSSYGLIASNVQLARALAALGLRRLGPDKRIPDVVWTWNANLQRAFLDGYCDADGHRPANQARHGERTYHSASEELIEDVRALHIMLGDAVSNVSVTKRTKPITIKGKVVKHARPQYGFAVWSGGKTGEAALRKSPGMAEWLDAGDFTISAVRDVTYKGEQDTWDLEVEGAHNFVADGVVVHNSGFMSALVNVVRRRNPHSRLFTTHSFGASAPAGFVRGMRSPFMVGVTDAGVGHMAGSIGGTAVESSGGAGVRVGGGARGAFNGLFTRQYGLRMAAGGGVTEDKRRLADRALRGSADREDVALAATLGLVGDPSSPISPARPAVPGYAAGGWVRGRPGRDKALLAATDGEFMVNRSAASANGPLLEAVNAGLGEALLRRTVRGSLIRGGDGASTAGRSTTHITVELHNHGVIGSQLDMDNWLTKSLDRVSRQGRLPAALTRADTRG